MSEIISSILQIKNALNEVVNLRKETIAKIETHTQRIQALDKELNVARQKNPVDEMQVYDLETQITQLQTIIHTLRINQQNNVYDMDAYLTSAQDQSFAELSEALNQIKAGSVTCESEPVAITFEQLDYIRCKHKALQLKIANRSSLIIYPTIVLVEDSNNSFYIVPTSELNIEVKTSNPSVGSETAQQHLHQLQLSIPTMYDETLTFENETQADQFVNKYISYISLLNSLNQQPQPGIRKDYFETVNSFGEQYIQFIKGLAGNETFVKHISSDTTLSSLSPEPKTVETLGLIDLLKCFNVVSDIQNTSSNESFSIMYLQARLNGLKIEKYEDVIQLNDQKVISYYKELVASVKPELNESPQPGNIYFNLASLLITFDQELHKQYIGIMYQYANLVIKADGRITKEEEDELKRLMLAQSEMNLAAVIDQQKEEEKEQTLEQLLYELYDLTGLQTVKREINTIINVIKIKKAREQFDLSNTDMSLHLVFSGNPGTGKTTIARELAKIYKCLGVLKKGHLIETDRSGMIAEYVGQTAIKVNKLVDSALDGVLFIDEAYAMYMDDKDTYGKEAIATLLKRMEDNRDRLIVILAGYTNEMQTFITSNPGLKSRFNKYIFFPDYTPDELYSIFIGMSRKLHFILEPKLGEKIKLRFLEEIEKGDPSFGNGRFVRNLFEKMMENQANRLSNEQELTKENLTLLKEVDLPE